MGSPIPSRETVFPLSNALAAILEWSALLAGGLGNIIAISKTLAFTSTAVNCVSRRQLGTTPQTLKNRI